MTTQQKDKRKNIFDRLMLLIGIPIWMGIFFISSLMAMISFLINIFVNLIIKGEDNTYKKEYRKTIRKYMK